MEMNDDSIVKNVLYMLENVCGACPKKFNCSKSLLGLIYSLSCSFSWTSLVDYTYL